MKLQKLKQKLAIGSRTLPFLVSSEELRKIEVIGKKLKDSARGCLRYVVSFKIF